MPAYMPACMAAYMHACMAFVSRLPGVAPTPAPLPCAACQPHQDSPVGGGHASPRPQDLLLLWPQRDTVHQPLGSPPATRGRAEDNSRSAGGWWCPFSASHALLIRSIAADPVDTAVVWRSIGGSVRCWQPASGVAPRPLYVPCLLSQVD